MWKWVSGCLVLVVVAAAAFAWWGFHKYEAFTADGGTAIVTIAASPERVFASLANTDSLATWTKELGRVAVSHHGTLVVGDTIRFLADSTSVTTTVGHTMTKRTQVTSGPDVSLNDHPTIWIVTAVKPNALLAMEMRTVGTNQLIGSHRDSLIAVGDSTRIVAMMQSAMSDSLAASPEAKGKAGASTMLEAASKLMLASMRMVFNIELGHLKARIEGR